MDADDYVAAIVAEPESQDRWHVYADWLLDQGDPRGELIELALAAEQGEASGEIKARLRAIESERMLLSPRLYAQSHLWWFSFARGFIRGAALMGALDDPPGFEAIHALFADRHAALLATLNIAHPIAEQTPLWKAVVEAPRPSVRRLVARDLGLDDARLADLPSLESLELDYDHDRRDRDGTRQPQHPMTSLVHPGLRRLSAWIGSCTAVIDGELDVPALDALAWDALDGLDLFANPRSILQNRVPPRLVSLRIGFVHPNDAIVARLADCWALRQLRDVRLVITRVAELEELVVRAVSFRHLDRLELDFMGMRRDLLDPDQLASLRSRLESALPTLVPPRWDSLLQRSPEPRDTRPLDEQSRGRDGRINAIDAWIKGFRR